MKKIKENLKQEIEIPEGITTSLDENILIIKKQDKELRRRLSSRVKVKIENNKIILESGTKRNDKRNFGTMKAHIKNMIKGLTEGFKYKLQVSSVHFPMNLEIDKSKNELVVKNFLGEKKDRRIKLVAGVDIKLNNDFVELESEDIEKAGQCATNIEKGTKVRNKDRRIFQDGIFIIEKPGRKFL